jgi:archaellum biogenesis protein FlaJ (TadC family)
MKIIFELLYRMAETVDDAERLTEIIEEQQELIDEYRKRFDEQDAMIKSLRDRGQYISLN